MTGDQRTELMILTMEEAGEMIQACSKVWRKNADDKSLNMLLEEVGDVYCMIKLMIEHDLLTWEAICQRAEVKRIKLKTWSGL